MTGAERGARATRLYPLPPRDEIPIENVYADLALPPSACVERRRPYVMVNMISSLDGKTMLGGKTSGIGGAVDRLLMRTLRSRADAVMIGANTLRAERLSLGLDEPARAPHPLAVVVTASGDVPAVQNLILGQGQDLLVMVPEGVIARASWGRGRALVAPAGDSGTISLRAALRILKAEHAVNLLLVEGGPSLNHSLISAGLVDELFVTLAPNLLGGTPGKTLTILDGPEFREAQRATLLSTHLCEDELFLRYRLQTP